MEDASSSAPSIVARDAGARLSAQASSPAGYHPAEEPIPETELGSSSGSLGSLLSEYGFSDPTPEHLAGLTITRWGDPAFLELTQDEAHELLALDDYMGLKGPGLMTAIAGPLPTLDDCRIGFQDPRVKAALQEVLTYEAALNKLGELSISEVERIGRGFDPKEWHSHWMQQRIQELVRMKDSAMIDMMQALEASTTAGNWRLWHRLHVAWSK